MKSLLDKINAKLNAQGGFLKAVSVLVGGTAFAQIIGLFCLPILTRLYSPDDFALFAVYASLLAILSVASCLRFEIAVPIPQEDSEAIQLVLLALISNLLISLLIGLIIWIFHTDIIFFLKKPDFAKLIWLLPIGVFFSGVYNALQYWTTRKKRFSIIARTRVVQSFSGSSIQIIMGLVGFATLGLIIGQIVKVSAGIGQLIKNYWKDASQIIQHISLKKLKQVFEKNSNFPKYSTLDALANTAGIQLPIIIIAALSLGPEAGYLMLAMQLLGVPMQFIGGAISQVYLAHAPEAFKHGNIRIYTIDVLVKLFKFSFAVLIFIGVVSPAVVGYIFGSQWNNIGLIISWMIPWFIFQLIASPISMIMHIANKQKTLLMLTLFGFILKISVIYIQYYIDSNYLLQAYAASSAVFYFICYMVFSKTALLKFSDHFYLFRQMLIPALSMSMFGILIVYLLKWSGL